MSFRKIQIIEPGTIGNPEIGHIYLGQGSSGLWEKFSDGHIAWVTTGSTYSGSSGVSGVSGSSGVDGQFYGTNGTSGVSGTSGTSGTSGKDGTSGTSGKDGTSGTSGKDGSSGKTGTSGSSGSGSSGVSGTSGSSGKGSSGTSGTSGFGSSGTSGINGGYGGASRMWTYNSSTTPAAGQFYAYSSLISGSTDLSIINKLIINYRDFDNQDLDNWLNSWTAGGIIKIEDRLNFQAFGLYVYVGTPYVIGVDTFEVSGFTLYNANNSLVDGRNYLISFVPTNSGNIYIGTSGTSGTSFINDKTFEFRDITAGTGQTNDIDIYASYGYTIESSSLETDNGTLTGVAIKINGSGVTSLSNLTIDTSVDTTSSTGSKTVIVGDRVTIVTSTGYTGSPTLLKGKITIMRS